MNKLPYIIGTAGHIDHGKTSLIRALTGIDTDRLKEEKERGISIDLGFAYFDLPDSTRYGIIDVPGHERFIKNMLAGAGGFDLVLFVVAADDGIMPQTREHLEIMHLLRIPKGIFVITKTDLADEIRIKELKQDINTLTTNTCLNNFPILKFSAVTSSGLNEIKEKILDIAKDIVPKSEGGFFRLPIDRSFVVKGFGAVVTGTVASGMLKKGSPVLSLPKAKKVKIRGLQSHQKDVEDVCTGQRAAVNLSGISHNEIKRGDFLVSTDLTKGAVEADVEFEFLKSMGKVVKNYSVLKLHHLTAETLAKVVFMGAKGEAEAGDKIFGSIKLKTPMVMMRGDRFILRDFSVNKTIGGGRVLLPFGVSRLQPTACNLRGHALSTRLMPPIETFECKPAGTGFEVLAHDNLTDIMLLLLSGRHFGIDRQFMRMQMNLTEEALCSIIDKSGDVMQLCNHLVLSKRLNCLMEKIINVLKGFHRTKQDEVGADENYLVREVRERMPMPLFRQIIDEMIKGNCIEREKGYIFLKGHQVSSGKDEGIENQILNIFKAKGFNPPKMDELSMFNGMDIKRIIDIMLRKGSLIRIAKDMYLSKDALALARARLAQFIDKNNKIKAAEFRNILGCGRKSAIEILEYFDKERFTLRSGDYRILRKR